MPDPQALDEWVRELGGEDLILWAGFDAALVGIAIRCGSDPVAVYDYERLLECCQALSDMTAEEAAEYLDFNVVGAYVGEQTPYTLYRVPDASRHAPCE